MTDTRIVTCPHCSTESEVPADKVYTQCGRALADLRCPNCRNQFQAEEEYLLWLGVEGPLPPDL